MNLTRCVSLIVLCASFGCNRTSREPVSPPASNEPHAASPAIDPHAAGAMPVQPPAAASDLTWDDPPGWQRERPSSAMRRAQYRIPRATGDANDAELVVITFGAGQGGDNTANLERWYGQVTQPDGRATREIATHSNFTVGTIQVTETEATGRLGGGSAMPGMPSSPAIEHGRLLAAIVDAGQGPWFFKITGPDATVAAARPAFEAMLRTLHTH